MRFDATDDQAVRRDRAHLRVHERRQQFMRSAPHQSRDERAIAAGLVAQTQIALDRLSGARQQRAADAKAVNRGMHDAVQIYSRRRAAGDQ